VKRKRFSVEQIVDTPVAVAHAAVGELAHLCAQVVAPILGTAVILDAAGLFH